MGMAGGPAYADEERQMNDRLPPDRHSHHLIIDFNEGYAKARGFYVPSRSASRRSVRNMCPGLCVIASGSCARMSAAWGVTPHAQKTGTSPALTSTGSP